MRTTTHPASEIVSRREERGDRRVHETYTSEPSDVATPKEPSGRVSHVGKILKNASFLLLVLFFLWPDTVGVSLHNHLGWRQGRLINHTNRFVKVAANCVPGFENRSTLFERSGATGFCDQWLPPGADSASYWKDLDVDFVLLPGGWRKLSPPYGFRSFWRVLRMGYNPLSYCFFLKEPERLQPCYRLWWDIQS